MTEISFPLPESEVIQEGLHYELVVVFTQYEGVDKAIASNYAIVNKETGVYEWTGADLPSGITSLIGMDKALSSQLLAINNHNKTKSKVISIH